MLFDPVWVKTISVSSIFIHCDNILLFYKQAITNCLFAANKRRFLLTLLKHEFFFKQVI